jgi:hypothetical protein
MNTRKKKRRTHLKGLDISQRDFSNTVEKRQLWHYNTFLYLRRAWQLIAIRGLAVE